MSWSRNCQIYVKEASTVAGKDEQKGPLSSYFDRVSNEDYEHETLEGSESKRLQVCIEILLQKAHISKEEIAFFVGGDLSDQLGVTHQALKEFQAPLIGIYGACSTITLSMIVAANFLKKEQPLSTIAFASSSYASAERQFRYPLEYGMQRKETSEHTVTGAGAILLTNQETEIVFSEYTIGDIHDVAWTDVNDMGTPMAFAAYQTLKDHLRHFHRTFEDYDLILTGDLSQVGTEMLAQCFAEDGTPLLHHMDAGLCIYDREKQKMKAGGSGAACLPLVAFSKVFQDLSSGKYRRVLLLATGALFSPTTIHQKAPIPVVAHAVTLERKAV